MKGFWKRLAAMAAAALLLMGCTGALADPTVTKPTAEGYEEHFDGYMSMVHKLKDGKSKLFGKLYIPDGMDLTKPHTTLILSHGIGMTHEDFELYIPHLMTLDVVCYAFDFCGGGNSSKSSGETTDMTIGTEMSNLKAVIDDLSAQPFCDPSKIVLSGCSFGGMVSGLVGAELQDKIAGEILIYPALCVMDNAHAEFASLDDIPATINVRGMKCGKALYSDSWDWDLPDMVSRYSGKVLLMHGTADSAVPYEYSVKEQTMFADAKLVTVEGGDHGFTAEQIETAWPEIVAYLTEIGVI